MVSIDLAQTDFFHRQYYAVNSGLSAFTDLEAKLDSLIHCFYQKKINFFTIFHILAGMTTKVSI